MVGRFITRVCKQNEIIPTLKFFIDQNWTELHDLHFLRMILGVYNELHTFDCYLKQHLSDKYINPESNQQDNLIGSEYWPWTQYYNNYPLNDHQVVFLRDYEISVYIQDEKDGQYLLEQVKKYDNFIEFSEQCKEHWKFPHTVFWMLKVKTENINNKNLYPTPYVSFLKSIQTNTPQTEPNDKIELFFSDVFSNEEIFPNFKNNYYKTMTIFKRNKQIS